LSEETTQEAKPSGVIRGDRGAEAAQVWICAFIVIVLGAIVYAPAFTLPFHGGELALFVDSPDLHRVASFPAAAEQMPGAPLTLLSYALNFGLPPAPNVALHAVTVLLHLLNGALLFLLARALLPRGTAPFLAVSAGVLFVTFAPLAETVCYLPLRPAVLATTFGLGAALALLRAGRDDALHLGWFGVGLVLFAAAAGAAFSALVPLLVALALLLAARRPRTHAAAPLGLLAVALLFLTAIYAAGTRLPLRPEGATLLYLGPAVVLLLAPALLVLLKQPPVRTAAGVLVAVLALASAYFANGTAAAMADPVTWWGGKTLPQEALEATTLTPEEAARQADWHTWQARAIMQAAAQVTESNARAGVLEQARVLLRAAVTLDPGNASRMKRLGAVLQETGPPDEAIATLEDVLRLDPFDQEATARLAALVEEQARREGDQDGLLLALDYYDRAADLGPLPANLAVRRAIAHAAVGDFESAVPVLKQAVGDDGEHPLAPELKQFEAMLGLLQQLRAREAQARAEDPAGMDVLLARAEAALLQGKAMDAFYLLDLALLREPDNARAWAQMGVVCARLGETAGFLRQWGGAAKVGLDAWQALALQCAAGNLWTPAREYLAHAAAQYPDAPLPLVALADVALKLGQPQRAQGMLEQAAKDHPESPDPWLKLADIAIEAGNLGPVPGWLNEAETRGADPEALQVRREKTGATPGDASQVPRTIMR